MNFYPIFKKELSSYFTSAIVYIVLTIFLVISGYFFYTDLIYFVMMGMSDIRLWMWQYLFNDIRFALLFIIPLLTMRLFAEEKKSGTIELLSTYPLRDIEILLGKFMACLVVFALMLSLSSLYPIILKIIFPDQVSIGPLISIYLGAFLLGCTFISCGILISSLTENQITAAMVTLGILILFWYIAWNEGVGSEAMVNVLLHLSLFDRYNSFTLGIIESKNIIFFVCFIVFSLFLTLLSLGSRRWRGLK